MSDAGPPFIRSNDGDRSGITEGGVQEVAIANRLVAALTGESLIQFRMGYGVHLEVGADYEVTIETPFHVNSDDIDWGGEPLTAEAAGALLPLISYELTSSHVSNDGTLTLGLGSATLTVQPHTMYEAWQVRGPDGLLIVCSPGGDYIAVWEPEGRT